MADPETPKIFISYRRQDSEDAAGRLKEKLSERFGEERVFFDVDSIPVGVDFRRYLEDAVSQCDVFLALIGRDWLTAENERGERRIDDPADFVRIEIESAFAQGITVIPVLVRRAVMPQSSDLPEGLKELAFRNGAVIGSGRDYSQHVERLCSDIERAFGVVKDSDKPVGQTSTAQESAEANKPGLIARLAPLIGLLMLLALWVGYGMHAVNRSPPPHDPEFSLDRSQWFGSVKQLGLISEPFSLAINWVEDVEDDEKRRFRGELTWKDYATTTEIEGTAHGNHLIFTETRVIKGESASVEASVGTTKEVYIDEHAMVGTDDGGISLIIAMKDSRQPPREVAKAVDRPQGSSGFGSSQGSSAGSNSKGVGRQNTGKWLVNTRVAGSTKGRGVGLNGHYTMDFKRRGSELSAKMTKHGYGKKSYSDEQRQHGKSTFKITKSKGQDFEAQGEITLTREDGTRPIHMFFSLSVGGDSMRGWWSYRGASFESSGMWGSLTAKPTSGAQETRPWPVEKVVSMSDQTCEVQCTLACGPFEAGAPSPALTPAREACQDRCAQAKGGTPSTCFDLVTWKKVARTKRTPKDLKWTTLNSGTFTMGTSEHEELEAPPHTVRVDAFSMMTSEVSVDAYWACVLDGRCSVPDTEEMAWKNFKYCTLYSDRPNAAMNCVEWDQAQRFCAWAGGRLPSEEEWEYAARGTGNGGLYPWGDVPDWSCDRSIVALGKSSNTGMNANKRACGTDRVADVCTKPMGASPEGICDLAGNVWEWTAGCKRPNYSAREDCDAPERMVRGGGFWSNALQTRSTRRRSYQPLAHMDVGFRCVK